MRKAVLGAAALIVIFGAVALMRPRDAAPAPRRPLAGAAGAVVRVEARKDGRTRVLEKKAGAWSEPEGAAIAAGLARLSLSSEVSREPEHWERYGVDESRAVFARVWLEGESSPSLELYLGAPAFGGVRYARLKDEAAVVLADGAPPELLR